MKSRQRKKWLKQHNKYINPRECWELDYTIAKFVLPRLKKFKKDTIGYPGHDEMDTFEKWQETLDKMILAFEYIVNDDWWFGNPEYDYSKGLHIKELPSECENWRATTITEDDWVAKIKENHKQEEERRQAVIEEGLQLFAKYFQHLWW